MSEPVYPFTDNPSYHEEIRKIQNSDPVNADTIVNPLIEKMLENTHFVKNQHETHAAKKDNPHSVTAEQAGAVPVSRTVNGKILSADITISASDVGLGNVNNTADIDKPISTATQTALNGKANSSHSHTATDITQDSSHRFVTDSEKSAWNGKATSGDLTSHTGDTTKHITASERTAWNAKAAGSHSHAATDITQDTSHRFVTDSEKTTWNGKANASHGTHVSYSSTAPKMNGTASVGSASTVARSDHVHPTDTSRAAASHTHSYLPLSGGTLTGNLTLKGSGNYGTKINLGDGDYVHLAEVTDDNLEIKAKNIDFVVSGKLMQNGSPLPLSNPNLLDNWYFSNAINQRLQSSYTGTHGTYTIDRWELHDSGVTLTVSSDCISVKTTKQYSGIFQQFENNCGVKAGDTLTFSADVKSTGSGFYLDIHLCHSDNTKVVGTEVASGQTLKAGLNQVTITVPSNYTAQTGDFIKVFICNKTDTTGTAYIKRAKLEYGSVSTLQNDPPPNYALELAKCQRYYFRTVNHLFYPGALYNEYNGIFTVPSPVSMRIAPSIKVLGNPGCLIMENLKTEYDNTTSPNWTFSSLNYTSSCVRIKGTSKKAYHTGPALLCDYDFEFSADL